MEYALTADHHRVHAFDAEKGQAYYCPVCGNQVIPRQGVEHRVNSWHFAHVRIKGNPRDWYICPKTHDWHNNQCRECQNNLINEFRTGTDYRQGGLFFYCAYPRIIHEADKYGEVHLPSIRF